MKVQNTKRYLTHIKTQKGYCYPWGFHKKMTTGNPYRAIYYNASGHTSEDYLFSRMGLEVPPLIWRSAKRGWGDGRWGHRQWEMIWVARWCGGSTWRSWVHLTLFYFMILTRWILKYEELSFVLLKIVTSMRVWNVTGVLRKSRTDVP